MDKDMEFFCCYLYFFGVVIVLCVSTTNPKTYKEDLREIEKSKLMDGYRTELIEAFIYDAQHNKRPLSLVGLRYAEILHLAEERERLYDKQRKPLLDLVSVEVTEKGFGTFALNHKVYHTPHLYYQPQQSIYYRNRWHLTGT